jgi:apolipoprotein D and lipocalin family protein
MCRLPRLALLLLGALPGLGGCAGTPENPPATVASVDLNRYAGTWYEIARFPNSFEDGRGIECTEVTATYTPRPDGRLGVLNRCRNAAAGGAPRDAEGSAYVVEGSQGAKLRVSFFWPFYGDYWVLGLDPDYRWAVVGDRDREYLWVLSRRPVLAAGDYAEAVGIARAEGFEIGRLQITPQRGG